MTGSSRLQAAVLAATPEAVEQWLGVRPEVLERVLRAAPAELLQRALASRPTGPPPDRPADRPPGPGPGLSLQPSDQNAMVRVGTPGPSMGPSLGPAADGPAPPPPAAGRTKRNSVTSDLFQMWLGSSPIKRSKSPSR